MYLETFRLPGMETEEMLLAKRMEQNGGRNLGYIDNPYPCGLFPAMDLRELNFERITILYGGNGSGKTTLLNLITQKLGLYRSAPFNSGEMMESFVSACSYETGYDDYGEKMKIPEGSRIITSDDIFEYMLAARSGNDEIESSKEEAKEDWAVLKYGKGLRFTGMDDYEDLRLQNLARSRSVSRRKFLKKTLGEEVRLASNGETALLYFEKKLESDTLYCLDEPENSMSPRMQLELKKLLETQVRFCGCQLIVATHSPFLLSMQGARIYDLDETPVDIRNWWELENVRIYYDFFKENRELFED
jgi:predicted ATPase